MADSDTSKEHRGMGVLTYLGAGVASIAAAAAAGYATVRDRFGKDLRQSVSINDAMHSGGYPTHEHYLGDLESYAQAFINGDGSANAARQWSKSVGARKVARADEIMKFLGEKGFPNQNLFEHIEGIGLRYQMMSPNSKRDVIANAALTATVAFAGIMSYLSSTYMRHHMDRIENRLDRSSNEPGR